LEDPIRKNYIFVGWDVIKQLDGRYRFVACWEEDFIGENMESDGIPDKYQKVVVFRVENGTWPDSTDEDKLVVLTMKDIDGNWDVAGTAELRAPTGMIAAEGYEGGEWDSVIPDVLSGHDTVTFTFSFEQVEIPQDGAEGFNFTLWTTVLLAAVAACFGLKRKQKSAL